MRLAFIVATVVLVLASGCASEPDPRTDPLARAKANDERLKAAQAAQRERDRAALEEQTRRERAQGAEDLSGQEGEVPRGTVTTGSGAARTTMGLRTGTNSVTAARDGPWKRDLLERYGPALTGFQRSALQAARLSSYESGETMCKRWIEENRKYDEGGAPSGN